MTMETDTPARVVPAGAELLPGYRVEALLARGGRVDTYDATDLDRDCRVVVKVVRPDRAHEEHVRAAVLTEGELLTGLAHPHLVRGYEVVRGPQPAVVLEVVPGATLAAVLDDDLLGAVDTALVGRQLVSVLGHLHRHGWLHLDVKPENVVVQEGRVVLIDLGLAGPPGLVEHSIGTVGYAAPEQDAGGTVSAATDVWGLGATLHECLTGRAPGRGPHHPGRVPGPLGDLVAACLRPDAADRPTLPELRSGLEALLEGADISETAAERPGWRSSWWSRMTRRPRRSRPAPPPEPAP